jgi:hypothetical protein
MPRVQSPISPVLNRSYTYGSTTTVMPSPDDIYPAENYYKLAASPDTTRPKHPLYVYGNDLVRTDSIPVQSTTFKASGYSFTSPCNLGGSENNSTSPSAKSTLTPPLPLIDSLGGGGCLSIVGGAIGVLTILGFLAFLWFGYGTEPEARGT